MHMEKQVAHQSTNVTKDEMTWAVLAHISGLIFSFLGPLVIWLIKKDEQPFVNDQAKEALNFQITLLIGMMISVILSLILIGFLIMFALMIFEVIVVIIAAVESSKGKAYRYPLNIRFIN